MGVAKVVFDSVVGTQFHEQVTAVPSVKLRAVMLEAVDGNRVELLQYLSHPREAPGDVHSYDIGCSHIAFQVDDIERMHTEMSAAGVWFHAPPLIDPAGYAKVTYCHDFDGTIVELVQVLDESNTIYES